LALIGVGWRWLALVGIEQDMLGEVFAGLQFDPAGSRKKGPCGPSFLYRLMALT
jgi:hypothetical protein